MSIIKKLHSLYYWPPHGANLHIFRMKPGIFHLFHMKPSISWNFNVKIWTGDPNTWKRQRSNGIFWHFLPSDDLSDPSRLLSASLSLAAIMRLWEVRRVEVSNICMTRGSQQDNMASTHLSSR